MRPAIAPTQGTVSRRQTQGPDGCVAGTWIPGSACGGPGMTPHEHRGEPVRILGLSLGCRAYALRIDSQKRYLADITASHVAARHRNDARGSLGAGSPTPSVPTLRHFDQSKK